MRRGASLLGIVVLVVAACQAETPASSTTITRLETTTSTVTATTSTVESTTTSVSSTTTEVPMAGPDWYWPEPPTADGPAGSGCTPGSEALPDGFWFGIAIEHRTAEIAFDLACWFDDPDAENGYRIANDSPNVRTIQVAADTMVWRVDLDAEGGLESPIPYSEWVGNYSVIVSCPGDFCLVWLRTEAGVIREIVEQYVP